MKASENTSPQHIHTASAAIKTENAASAGHEAPVVQRRANDTGLPDNLKTGIENLSGYSLDDVKVHYNSAQPAQLQAHAYAQGSDIHVAPGQEKHLPHEAWHVVQQKQGRVKATTQLKGQTPVNDDAGLEKEADVMGAKALSVTPDSTIPLNLKSVSAERTVQKKGFASNTSPSLGTAASVIKTKTGVPAGKQKLPDTDGLSSATERAESISALISKDTVGDEARLKSNGNLSKTTGMARDEAFILMGADPKKFYDAGHLIGDQLLKKLGKTYSFVMKNLAPQTAGFNAPSYSELMENPIKEAAVAGKTVEMNVNLAYPKAYTVTIEQLTKRGVIDVAQDKGQTINIKDGKANIKKSDALTIPRRIPKKWTLSAKEVSKPTAGKLDAFEKKTEDRAFTNMVLDPKGLEAKRTIKDSYSFLIRGVDPLSTLPVMPENKTDKWEFKEVGERILEARQWRPPLAHKVDEKELKGALQLYYPDVALNDGVLNEYLGIVQRKDVVAVENIGKEFLQVIGETFGVNIPVSDYEKVKNDVLQKFSEARQAFEKSDNAALNKALEEVRVLISDFKTLVEKIADDAGKTSQTVRESIKETRKMLSELSGYIEQETLLKDVGKDLFLRSLKISDSLAGASDFILDGKLGDALTVLKEVITKINELREEVAEVVETEKKKSQPLVQDIQQPEPKKDDQPLNLNLTIQQNVPDISQLPPISDGITPQKDTIMHNTTSPQDTGTGLMPQVDTFQSLFGNTQPQPNPFTPQQDTGTGMTQNPFQSLVGGTQPQLNTSTSQQDTTMRDLTSQPKDPLMVPPLQQPFMQTPFQQQPFMSQQPFLDNIGFHQDHAEQDRQAGRKAGLQDGQTAGRQAGYQSNGARIGFVYIPPVWNQSDAYRNAFAQAYEEAYRRGYSYGYERYRKDYRYGREDGYNNKTFVQNYGAGYAVGYDHGMNAKGYEDGEYDSHKNRGWKPSRSDKDYMDGYRSGYYGRTYSRGSESPKKKVKRDPGEDGQ